MVRANLGAAVALAARRAPATVILTLAALALTVSSSDAQIGQLVSPGPLAKAHADLEGASNCQKCHEPGRKVTATLCLSCHKPVAERIRLKKGVHRDVKDDCTRCHTEHQGVDGVLRNFDHAAFDHTANTSFPLDGKHAAVARECSKCHTSRSFLTAQASCSSCHADVHKGTLGTDCQRCHPTTVAFKDAQKQFDHGKAAFPLTGAHQRVQCVKCHVGQKYKGLPFAQCTDCHKSPHASAMATACLGCHTTDSWRTQKVDHAKTAFPLRGAHATVPCAKCHIKPPTKAVVKFDRCATCHTDPHKGSFKQDCSSCHTESTFKGGRFDHASTKFSLTGKHTSLACVSCHKNVPPAGVGRAGRTIDFRGNQTACVSCHKDVHGGELGATCETCHTSTSFKLNAFEHPRFPEFFSGSHASLTCAGCHIPPVLAAPVRTGAPVSVARYKNLPTACATCHKDPHLGQVGTACERCHTITTPKFAVATFAHESTKFPLTGKHQGVECRKCHKPETGAFPSGRGTAVRLKPLATACASCHQDIHLGQLGTACEVCHSTGTFKLPAYVHAKQMTFMAGKHAAQPCSACHKAADGGYPAGRGVAIRYKMGQACESCHTDQHQGQMGKTCETCHTPASWRVISRAFHKAGVFPLEGRHLAVECVSCHLNGAIKGTPAKCYDCHWIRRQDDRYRTRLGRDCGSCHRPVSWTAVNWNHGTFTGLQLSPVHRALGCDGCHKNQAFQRGDVTCYSCHAEDYQKAKNPNHLTAGFPIACEACHRASHTSWSQTTFSHGGYFPLTGRHATQACSGCHKNSVYKGTPRDCVGCHRTNYDRTTNPPHAAAGFPTTCESCHRATDLAWTGVSFNHTTYFTLAGVHATQTCSACHKNNVYKGTSRDCIGCHRTNYDRTTSPNHVSAGFPTTCDSCHRASDTSWTGVAFNHNAFYPLAGVHTTQACSACHKNNVYKGTPRDCIGCHRTNYDRTTSPNHVSAGFPTTCDSCHRASDTSWRTTFNHSSVFPLVGRHAVAACAACHVNNVYKGTPRECVGCHRTTYDRTTSPPHVSAGFSTACDSCHKATDTVWTSGVFNHNSVFQLVGRHGTAACASCHVNNVYKGTPRDCVGCHRTTYDRTTSPPHVSAGFSTTCDSCHKATDATWTGAVFNHNSVFQLVGRHAVAACTSCHVNNVYKGTPRDCVGCHRTTYDRTTNPPHVSAGFSTACETCHKATDTTWASGVFNHNTVFALVGRHGTAACASCHVNNVYKGTSRDCIGCHRTTYDRTTNPNHVAAGFPTTCEQCHSASASTWTSSFNHGAFFPLLGRHQSAACASCHVNNVYKGTARDCIGCHRTTYDRTTNPNHVAAGFPTTCEQCHSASASTWTSSFNHGAFFPLLGRHQSAACASCHVNNVYKGTSRDCIGCHRTTYDRTSNPNHVAAGFPTTCEQCHSASASTWTSSFNHGAFFPLLGRHQSAACASCHVNNVYKGTPRDCIGCHRTNYDRTTNPNHVAAGFPTTCEQCHSASASTWTSSFNHNAIFPLLGRHLTASCTSCHKNNVYKGTSRECYPCHTTQYDATTNPNHRGAGFPTSCDACHKASDTAWNQGKFNHTWFPITSGRHAGRQCVECHQNPSNYKVFQCTTACHPQSKMDSEHKGRAGYRYDSAACYSCHPTGRAD